MQKEQLPFSVATQFHLVEHGASDGHKPLGSDHLSVCLSPQDFLKEDPHYLVALKDSADELAPKHFALELSV